MSLNNLHLHPQLLAGLYSQTLIETDAVSVSRPTIKSLGGNKKNILLVVFEENQPALPDQSLQFLITILKACRLTLADVAIVATGDKKDLDYKTYTSHFESREVLLFNLAPVDFGLPFHFPEFQIQRFDNRTYLSAPALPVIEKDVETKKQLWMALKNLFSL
jgi:hypothetical protein